MPGPAFKSTCVALGLLVVGLFLCAPMGAAQEAGVAAVNQSAEHWRARLFDFYGQVGHCDETARLDNFAIELMNNPTFKGHIIFYEGHDILPGQKSEWHHLRAADYLTNMRQLEASRLTSVYGGFREQRTTELWIVPEGTLPPEPSNTISPPTFGGRTYQYNSDDIDFPYEPTPEELAEAEQEESAPVMEEEASAASVAVVEEVEPQSPANPSTSAVDVESEVAREPEISEAELQVFWASEGFARAVQREGKGALAYIIYYADDATGELAKLQEVAGRGKQKLVSLGLQPQHIVLVYGGFLSYPRVETWVVPAKSELPEPKPEARPANEEPETSEIEISEVPCSFRSHAEACRTPSLDKIPAAG